MARRNKEVYFNETRAYRGCNPLNIRWNMKTRWLGQTGRDERGFCRFSAFSWGYRAAVMIMRSYRKRGITTVGRIISTWAPRTENDTEKYVESVVQTMSACRAGSSLHAVDSSTEILLWNRELVVSLLLAMTRVEMGANASQVLSMRTYAEMGYDLAMTTG